MNATRVADGIFRLFENVGQEILFEGMWPLPHGLTMSSYLVKGEECALIDGVCGWDGVPESLLAQLEAMSVDPAGIRYVVLNHLEPDHTAWLERLATVASDFTLCASEAGLALARAIRQLEHLDIRTVAPAHGIIWQRDPRRIIDLYTRLAGYARGPAEPEITVVWGSMYGMTGSALPALLEGIASVGVPVHLHRVPQTHVSEVLASAWRSTGIIVGAPTYEYRMFPPVAAALDELGRKKVVRKTALFFGSYGWSGGAQKELQEIMERYRMRWEFLEPVEFNGRPSPGELRLLRERGTQLARRVRETGGLAATGEAAS